MFGKLFARATFLSIATVSIFSTSAAQAQVNEFPYSNARGWDIVSASDNRGFLGCGMSRQTQAFDLYLGQENNGSWKLGFPTASPEGSRMTIDMDLGRYSDLLEASVKDGIANAPVNPDWVNSIAQGRSLSVLMEGRRHEISLRGTAAAILKVKECVLRQGQLISASPKIAVAPIENDAARLGVGCPVYGSMRSPGSQDKSDIIFTNRVDRAINIYWIDFQGKNMEMGNLRPGETVSLASYAGHLFIAKDFSGTCFGGVWTVALGGNNIDIF